MADETTQPKPADPGANGAAASGGGEEAKPSGDKPNGTDPVLSFLKDATGREYASVDEAKKSITNLNSLVGDREIAKIRDRAKLADTFDKIVEGYASENGLSLEDARNDLLTLADGEAGDGGDNQNGSAHGDPAMAAKLADVTQRLDVADLLKAHPEAQHVMNELKDLAKARGTSLQDTYEASAVLKSAATAAAASSSKDARPSATTPNNRISAEEHASALEKAKSAFESDRSPENADRLVAATLGLK